MKGILICLIVIAFATSNTFSIYAADDTSQTKAKNEVNKATSTINELPGKVKSALTNRCPTQDVKDVTKESYQGKTAYEVTCTKNGTTHYILMDKNGKLIRDESSKYEQNENKKNNK